MVVRQTGFEVTQPGPKISECATYLLSGLGGLLNLSVSLCSQFYMDLTVTPLRGVHGKIKRANTCKALKIVPSTSKIVTVNCCIYQYFWQVVIVFH